MMTPWDYSTCLASSSSLKFSLICFCVSVTLPFLLLLPLSRGLLPGVLCQLLHLCLSWISGLLRALPWRSSSCITHFPVHLIYSPYFQPRPLYSSSDPFINSLLSTSIMISHRSPKLKIICPSSPLVFPPQWMVLPFTQITKPELYGLSLIYSPLSFLRCK